MTTPATTETVVLEGHIVDRSTLPTVLDLVIDAGAEYRLVELDIGRTRNDPSRAVIELTTVDEDSMDALLERLQVHGANRNDDSDAVTVPADRDGVLPVGFHSTTNLPTEVRIAGHWIEVRNPEMDCAIVVDGNAARTEAMHRVREGERVIVGRSGVRVRAPHRHRSSAGFEFMDSEVSSEKPKGLLVARVADRMREARRNQGRILAVCGPAVVHTGGTAALARLVRDGWIDVLFAGNGFATHDIETNAFGTSLGVSVDDGRLTRGGHSNHLRILNEVRRLGSIAGAVEAGYVTGGVMYECVRRGVPFVLGGSVRDDGPLPDTITDVVEAADAMRALVPGVDVALMLASTLHAIATGNLLPATVSTYCIDINPAVATKLSDRGSHQATGIVTDVGPFLADLGEALDT